jgi:hypothetical protein
MAPKPLLPQAFWFRIAVPCHRIENMPRAGRRGRLLDLPETNALPDLRQLEGDTSWAQVRVGWNPGGLGIAVQAEGVSREQLDMARPEGFAVAEFWVDTRDTRTVARATRFCHRFRAALEPGGARGQLNVKVAQQKIAQATADAPIRDPELIVARAELFPASWMLELFLPTQALNGFDVEVNRRLGFSYQIADYVRDDQFFTVGREFPIGENPSLWSTLELRD